MTRAEDVTIKELHEINKSLEVIASALKELAKPQKKSANTTKTEK